MLDIIFLYFKYKLMLLSLYSKLYYNLFIVKKVKFIKFHKRDWTYLR